MQTISSDLRSKNVIAQLLYKFPLTSIVIINDSSGEKRKFPASHQREGVFEESLNLFLVVLIELAHLPHLLRLRHNLAVVVAFEESAIDLSVSLGGCDLTGGPVALWGS